LCVAFLI